MTSRWGVPLNFRDRRTKAGRIRLNTRVISPVRSLPGAPAGSAPADTETNDMTGKDDIKRAKRPSWFRSYELHEELYLHRDLINELAGKRDMLARKAPDQDASCKPDLFESTPPRAINRPKTVRKPRATYRRSSKGPGMQLFDPAVLASLRRQVEGLSKSNERRALIESLSVDLSKLADGVAPLARVPRNLATRLSRLREDMPNFASTLDFIAPLLVLQQAGDGAVRLPPLLLDGPPGIGKTYFAQRLADVLGLHYRAIGLEAATAHWLLSGANLTWQSGGPGLVLRTLAAAHQANPLILLDEVDKADPDYRHSPLKALYALLEANSARAFRDEAVPDLVLDASAINWILTSNDSTRVAEPLLSRVRRVEVPAPNAKQRRQIVSVVYRTMRTSHRWGRRFAPTLKPRTIDALATLDDSVRQLQRVLVQACATALTANRSDIEPQDIAAALRGPVLDLESMPPQGNA